MKHLHVTYDCIKLLSLLSTNTFVWVDKQTTHHDGMYKRNNYIIMYICTLYSQSNPLNKTMAFLQISEETFVHFAPMCPNQGFKNSHLFLFNHVVMFSQLKLQTANNLLHFWQIYSLFKISNSNKSSHTK